MEKPPDGADQPENPKNSRRNQQNPPPLLTLRAAVIFLLALLAGGLVGVLAYYAVHNTAAAVLAGLSATGATVLGLNRLIVEE